MSDTPQSCESCGYETEALKGYHGEGTSLPRFLCEICASSFLSNITEYRRNSTYAYEVVLLARSVGHVANVLLAEIRKLGEAKEKT